MLIFSNDDEKDAQQDELLLVKTCNSSSLISGLFDKFASFQFRSYLYRLLAELSFFFIDELCELSFDEATAIEYDDYLPVLSTLGLELQMHGAFLEFAGDHR